MGDVTVACVAEIKTGTTFLQDVLWSQRATAAEKCIPEASKTP